MDLSGAVRGARTRSNAEEKQIGVCNVSQGILEVTSHNPMRYLDLVQVKELLRKADRGVALFFVLPPCESFSSDLEVSDNVQHHLGRPRAMFLAWRQKMKKFTVETSALCVQFWWWRTTVWKLSIVFLSVMRVIMPWISSNPFDLVSEEGSRQP